MKNALLMLFISRYFAKVYLHFVLKSLKVRALLLQLYDNWNGLPVRSITSMFMSSNVTRQ